MKKLIKMLCALLAISVLMTSVSFATDSQTTSSNILLTLSAVDALKPSKLTNDDTYEYHVELASKSAPIKNGTMNKEDETLVDGYTTPADPVLGTPVVSSGTGSVKVLDNGNYLYTGNLNSNAVVQIPVTFSAPGHYSYAVTEVAISNKNEVKVKATYEARFTVAYDKDGNLKVLSTAVAENPGDDETKAMKSNPYGDPLDPENPENPDNTTPPEDPSVPFKHEKNPEVKNITVDNTVTGNVGDKDKDFTYTVEIGGNATGEYTITKTDKDGNTTTTKVTPNNPATVTLKDGEKFTIEGLPEGSTYKITEEVPGGYTVPSLTDDGTELNENNKTNGVVEGTTGKTDKDIKYVNNADIAPATALMIDMMPYAVCALLVAAAGVFLMKKKSHTSEF